MHIYTPSGRTTVPRAAVPRGLVGSVLGYGVASQFIFSVNALFPGCTGSNPHPPKSHFNEVLYPGVSRYTPAQYSMAKACPHSAPMDGRVGSARSASTTQFKISLLSLLQ